MPRRFVFIDESGDPGTQSPFFVAAAVDVASPALVEMRRLFAPLRHFNEMHKEVKTAKLAPASRPRRRACETFRDLIEKGEIVCTVVHAIKEHYTGPYLGKQGLPVWPTRFRNVMLRLLLEHHFAEVPVVTDAEVEIVFDRVSMSVADRKNLEKYLAGNRRLPTIQHFTHVDSEYTDAILLPDLAATLVKEHLKGITEPDESRCVRELFHCVDVTSP